MASLWAMLVLSPTLYLTNPPMDKWDDTGRRFTSLKSCQEAMVKLQVSACKRMEGYM